MREQPKNKISKKGLTLWRWYGLFQTVMTVLVVAFIVWLGKQFGWPDWLPYVGIGIVLLEAVLSIVVLPKIRWIRWRYEVRETEIEIQHGIFIIHRTLVPMVRVQHVDTTQGPLLRHYNLAVLTISTAATTHAIPAIPLEEADSLRRRISDLAKVAEDDV